MILGIYSASGGGKETFDLATDINAVNKKWSSYVFIDDTKPKGSTLWGYSIFSFEEITNKFDNDSIEIIIGVGEPNDRKLLYDKIIASGYKLATLIHPNSYVSNTAKIGVGVIISYNAYISCETIIEDNVRVMPLSGIGHNVHISKHSAISGHSDIGGYTKIGSCSYIGLNVCVREHINIGSYVVVSAGSAVLKDLPDSIVAQGNPARPIIRRTDERVFKKISGVNC